MHHHRSEIHGCLRPHHIKQWQRVPKLWLQSCAHGGDWHWQRQFCGSPLRGCCAQFLGGCRHALGGCHHRPATGGCRHALGGCRPGAGAALAQQVQRLASAAPATPQQAVLQLHTKCARRRITRKRPIGSAGQASPWSARLARGSTCARRPLCGLRCLRRVRGLQPPRRASKGMKRQVRDYEKKPSPPRRSGERPCL